MSKLAFLKPSQSVRALKNLTKNVYFNDRQMSGS